MNRSSGRVGTLGRVHPHLEINRSFTRHPEALALFARAAKDDGPGGTSRTLLADA